MSSRPTSSVAFVFPAAPAHARSTSACCYHCNVLPLARSCPPPTIITFSSHAHTTFPSRLHGATAGNHHYNQNVIGKSVPFLRGGHGMGGTTNPASTTTGATYLDSAFPCQKPLCRGHLGTLESNGCVYSMHCSFALFLGLSHDSGMFLESDSICDVVVGMLDTGVSPEHKSYDGTRFGPVTATWKGACEEGKDFKAAMACNRKLIGAPFFCKGYEASIGPVDESRESRSPCDGNGHGTQTSRTAAGNFVQDASLLGYASGRRRSPRFSTTSSSASPMFLHRNVHNWYYHWFLHPQFRSLFHYMLPTRLHRPPCAYVRGSVRFDRSLWH
ncbi:hypothetical protein Taro_042317 [Colocasia esculenta]|uniref:Subtilisin n=1 Tax=Colocasia esculenta TaxID=4460 RepID=A0A843WNN7_COLES|nr:hypothetical protein [Colocasia esculenta]